MPTRGKTDSQKAWKPDCGIETHKASGIHVDIPRQKAWKPDCGIETADGGYVRRRVGLCQKAWKPDCGIETQKVVDCHCYFCSVRRPGSPIAGLKPCLIPSKQCLHIVRRPGSPIAGLKHPQVFHNTTSTCVRRPGSPIAGLKLCVTQFRPIKDAQSEGLEARLRD